MHSILIMIMRGGAGFLDIRTPAMLDHIQDVRLP